MWLIKSVLSCLLCVLSTQAMNAPECQSIAPNQTLLGQVRTSFSSTLPGLPFGLIYAIQPGFAFVSLNTDNRAESSTLGVLNTTVFPPILIHEIVLNDISLNASSALGLALSNNGKHLFIAAGTGAYIIDTHKAVMGVNGSVVGVLKGDKNVTGDGAIEITLTHDDRFALVSQEYGSQDAAKGNIDVFKLHRSEGGTVWGEEIGHVSLGGAVVGSTLSPDGRFLYVTSEIAGTNYTSAGLASANHGILSVLNVSVLVTKPNQSQIANVTAGCEPVREIVSSDGRYVWVTSRASNHVLAFNASALIHDPENALLASVQVGTSPVGITFVNKETRIITADSDRFGAPDAHTGLSVVDVAAALSGRGDAMLGYIATSLFPREFATSHDKKTLLVADFSSDQVQAVDLATLP